MTQTAEAPGPVFINLPQDQALHADPPAAEIWYITTWLQGEGRRFGVQAILTASLSGRLFSSLSLVDLGQHGEWHSIQRFDPGSVVLSTDELHIATPTATLRGSTDELSFRAEIDGNTAELTLRRQYPVVYNCGTGLFPYFHGPTYQYAFAGLAVTGTVTIDGVPHPVEGGGWFDRQWSASRDAFGTAHGFTWFGLCLDNGHNLSLWDTTAPDGTGKVWATVVAPDGTHSVVSAQSTRHDGWTLSLPSLDATLEITHELIHDEHRFYSGILTVDGTYRGTPIHGYGVVDTVPN